MSKAADAYSRLAHMIETGALVPGALLTEAALMEAAETGRTPLREAVQALVRDRWLVTGTGRGLRVPPISVDDQLERLEVRRSLETLAVGLACVRATEKQLSDVRAHVADMRAGDGTSTYLAAVAKSHELLAGIANNRYLSDALTPLQGMSRRFWLATTMSIPGEVERSRGFYVPALESVVERDVTGARTGILALHDFLADSALGYAARLAEAGRIEPPDARPRSSSS